MLIPWASFYRQLLARHQLADRAPKAKVDGGWHPPYSSLASPLESKDNIQNHPKSPKLVGMLTGIWCSHGVSLRQEHGSMGICFDVLWHSCTAPAVVHRSMPRISEISLSTVKLNSEHENASLLAHF